MLETNDFDCLHLTLKKGKITSYKDLLNGEKRTSFHKRILQGKLSKIYVIKEGRKYLYVGTTTQSLTTRFRQGFKATGKGGYHGYKWKDREKIQLYIWCFPKFKKIQIESIEAEFAFLVRSNTGNWPLAQNEIHFNNEHPKGKVYAKQLFKHTCKNQLN